MTERDDAFARMFAANAEQRIGACGVGVRSVPAMPEQRFDSGEVRVDGDGQRGCIEIDRRFGAGDQLGKGELD